MRAVARRRCFKRLRLDAADTGEGRGRGHVEVALRRGFLHQALDGRELAVDGMRTERRVLREVSAPARQAGGGQG